MILLTSSLLFSCSKSEQEIFNSKNELLTSISKSNEFKEFFELSIVQSNLILASANISADNAIISTNTEIEKLQLAKKNCIERLSKIYSKNDLESLNKEDLRIIVKNIVSQQADVVTSFNSDPTMQTFDAASCKEQYDREVNDCFENFIIDEGACFLQGLWGVVSGCHVESVRDHLKCNRSADKHFRDCKN